MRRTLVEEFIRASLLEIGRYERETGKQYSDEVREELRNLVSDSPIPEYGFTMTSVPKVGVNPRTVHNTPIGVYFYPLNEEFYERLINNRLPYVSNAPYCSILKLNEVIGDKWLKFLEPGQNFANQQKIQESLKFLESSLENIRKNPLISYVFKTTLSAEDYAIKNAEHWDFNTDSKVFDATFLASRSSPRPASSSTQRAIYWTKILRNLGYVGIYDAGNSIIHEGEPCQGVCLDSNAYTVLKTFETSQIRKKSFISDEKMISIQHQLSQEHEVPESKLLYLMGIDERLAYAVASRNDLSERIIEALLNSGYPRIEFYLATNKSPGVTSEVLSRILDKKEMPGSYRREVEIEMSSRKDLTEDLAERLLSSPFLRPRDRERILSRNSRTEIEDF